MNKSARGTHQTITPGGVNGIERKHSISNICLKQLITSEHLTLQLLLKCLFLCCRQGPGIYVKTEMDVEKSFDPCELKMKFGMGNKERHFNHGCC